MNAVGLGAAGLALALGFALLGTRRTGDMAMLCAAQALVVAVAALAYAQPWVALVASAEAVALVWLVEAPPGGIAWLRLPFELPLGTLLQAPFRARIQAPLRARVQAPFRARRQQSSAPPAQTLFGGRVRVWFAELTGTWVGGRQSQWRRPWTAALPSAGEGTARESTTVEGAGVGSPGVGSTSMGSAGTGSADLEGAAIGSAAIEGTTSRNSEAGAAGYQTAGRRASGRSAAGEHEAGAGNAGEGDAGIRRVGDGSGGIGSPGIGTPGIGTPEIGSSGIGSAGLGSDGISGAGITRAASADAGLRSARAEGTGTERARLESADIGSAGEGEAGYVGARRGGGLRDAGRRGAGSARAGYWRAANPDTGNGGASYVGVAGGAVLAGLGAVVPGAGLPLAVLLLGLMVVAVRGAPVQQVLGLAAAQNGAVLAALSAGPAAAGGGLSSAAAGWGLALAALPWLPCLALGALWLGSDRARIRRLLARRPAGWIDFGLCLLALLLACELAWQGGMAWPFERLDPAALHIILLLAALAAAASWTRRGVCSAWGSRLALLAGTVIAMAAADPLQSMLGITLGTVGAVAAALPARVEAWQRLRLGCTGLGLVLFGAIAWHAAPPPLPAVACLMLGYATLAALAPELGVAAVGLMMRLRGAGSDELLLALGLAALLLAGLGLMTGPAPSRRPRLVALAQGGVAVFAFGLGSERGDLAGLLQLTCLALSQCALRLARPAGLDRVAAVAGLAGVPPFGLFPSLALVLAATAEQQPWLLPLLGGGLACIAWSVLRQLPGVAPRVVPGRASTRASRQMAGQPPGRAAGQSVAGQSAAGQSAAGQAAIGQQPEPTRRQRLGLLPALILRQLQERLPAAPLLPSPAWLPLVLLLIVGFAMPESWLAWFRLAAR